MSSHQLDPRSMSEATSVSNFAPGMQPRYMQRKSAWVVWVQFAGLMLILDGSRAEPGRPAGVAVGLRDPIR
jgi:hypothetical protein